MKKLLGLTAGIVAAAGLMVPQVSAQESTDSIAAVADKAGTFKTLLAALTAADLAPTFADCSAGPFTVFAPTDDAFAAALTSLGITADELLADKAKLGDILKYHVVDGKVDAATVVTLDGKGAKTLNGAEVMVKVTDGKVSLNGNVNVVTTDIGACNGIVHVIDGVLLPPAAAPAAPAAPAGGGDLPTTGSATSSLVLLGGLLLAGGAMVLFIGRRRVTA